ncbi:MAG TPA: hypothetical protein VF210_21435 [Pseudomonadales bacterium]
MPTLPPLPGLPSLRAALALSLCWALFDAAPAGAADFITVEDECNGRQLLIRGAIEPGDHERFANRLARLVAGGDLPDVQDPDVLWTVKLDSPGGDPDEAMRIGRLLRAAFATTEVGYRYARRPDGVWDFKRSGELVCLDGEDRLSGCHQDIVEAECTGACVLVWLAGAERHANEGRIGLHGLAGTGAPLRDYLIEMGVAPEWIDRLLDPPPSGSGWLRWTDRHELAGRARSLEQLVADCPPPLSRDESYQSVVAPDAEVRDALMARAEAHRSCRRTRLAAARADTLARLAGRLEHDVRAAVSQRGD